MPKIIVVINLYNFSNTHSVLSPKYVYILNENAQENSLIKKYHKSWKNIISNFLN